MGLLFRIVTFFGLPSWVAPVVILGLIGSGLGGAYMKGRWDASSACREASVRAELEAVKRDLDAAKQAGELSAKQIADLSAAAQQREEEIATYEAELKARPDRCDLSPSDVERLRLHNGAGKAKAR